MARGKVRIPEQFKTSHHRFRHGLAVLAGCVLLFGSCVSGRHPAVLPIIPDDTAFAGLSGTKLRYLAGLELNPHDPRVGGLSGLSISPDGAALLAVSDQAHWVRARLRHDAEGRLQDIADIRTDAMLDRDSRPLRGKAGDAESLALADDGTILVAFEREHRLWRYGGDVARAAASPVTGPAGLRSAPSNAGLEAITHLADGRILLLTEGYRLDAGYAAWVGRPGDWQSRIYVADGRFNPTGAATLPDGDVIVLERAYSPATGPRARIVRLPPAAIDAGTIIRGRELGRLAPPFPVDNFEGIAVRSVGGRTLLYLVSDDNFSPVQRTLLLQFELVE